MTSSHGLQSQILTLRPIGHKRNFRYISTDDRRQAFRFTTFLMKQALSLDQFPERGRVVPESKLRSYREIIVRAYRIVYRVDHRNELVEVIRFWHAGRAMPKLPE